MRPDIFSGGGAHRAWNLPEPMVRDDLNRGRLVALRLPEFSGGHYDLQAIYRTDMPAERPFNSIEKQ